MDPTTAARLEAQIQALKIAIAYSLSVQANELEARNPVHPAVAKLRGYALSLDSIRPTRK